MIKIQALTRLLILVTLILISLSCNHNPAVIIITESGEIEVELFQSKAPVTVNNFLRYVDSGLYQDGSFYRVVSVDNQPDDSIKIEVIQGGRRDYRLGGFDPIEHESTNTTGILHLNGVISMARAKVGTASSEFFICIGNQPELDHGGKRNSDGEGFAAFGRVIDGMDVVQKIHEKYETSQYLSNPVAIRRIKRSR